MTPSLSMLKLQALADVGAVVDKALDLRRALDDVLEILAGSLGVRRGAIALIGPDGQLEVVSSLGLSDAERGLGALHCAREYTDKIFRTMRPVHVPDVLRDPLFPDAPALREALGVAPVPYTGAPVVVDNEPVGVLSVDRLFDESFSVQEDIEFLTTLSDLVARIIRLNEQVRERERGLRRENAALRYRMSKDSGGLSLVGKSAPMAEVERLAAQAATGSGTVLLLGEAGSGKSHTARVIHDLSERRDAPFLRVNCEGAPPDRLERTLFGTEQGRGEADEPEAGLLEQAHGGTLLLDEVGELSPLLQSRLLHLLQNREFVRTGGGRPMRTDVRLIAASRMDLRERCDQGLFRASLFYRLRTLSITMPPLRARMEDVPGLFNHFRRRTADACGRDLYCTPEALELLLRHDWPGNVRELENIVERLVVMAEDGRVDERLIKLALAAEASSRPGGPGAHGPQAEGGGAGGGKPTLQEMERNEILLALSETGWIKRRAGKLLGLTERQIGYRIRKFGLDTKVAAERRRLRERRAS